MLSEPGSLEESYRRCRELTRRWGRSYYRLSFLLPRARRRHVWAIWAFCLRADDIVDDPSTAPAVRAQALHDLVDRFEAGLAAGDCDDAIVRAVVHTVIVFDLDPEFFTSYFQSMEMDLHVSTYETWDDLLTYIDGVTAVIGGMLLPILGLEAGEGRPYARDLGRALQFTDILRDVDEDLALGRVYLPQEDLRRFGADPQRRTTDYAWHRLMKFEIARCRLLYASADPGIAMLPPSSARFVRALRTLCVEILEQIRRVDDDVFSSRPRVSTARALILLPRALITSAHAR